MCVPFLSFLFFRLEDLDRDHWKIYIFLKNFFFFILLVERKPHVRCTEIKKKILHFSQRRILFFLGEERDCAAASGGLTFSIPSLKGVWGL